MTKLSSLCDVFRLLRETLALRNSERIWKKGMLLPFACSLFLSWFIIWGRPILLPFDSCGSSLVVCKWAKQKEIERMSQKMYETRAFYCPAKQQKEKEKRRERERERQTDKRHNLLEIVLGSTAQWFTWTDGLDCMNEAYEREGYSCSELLEIVSIVCIALQIVSTLLPSFLLSFSLFHSPIIPRLLYWHHLHQFNVSVI